MVGTSITVHDVLYGHTLMDICTICDVTRQGGLVMSLDKEAW